MLRLSRRYSSMDIEMPVPSRAITNAIQLGVNLLGWYGASFSDSPDDERLVVLVRVLLDNVGLENLRVPHGREARANFITNVALRLDFAGKKELSDAVRLGGALGAYDEVIQAQDPTNLDRLIKLAGLVGISETNIRALVNERKSLHQPDQAKVLLRHIQQWRESSAGSNEAPYIFLCHTSPTPPA